ncbi:MAG: SufD family Fe-S cluster assembly protein, partial [Lachnospiraceae bacterium]
MMTPIHVDTDLQLADGLFSYEIDSERKLNLTFRCQGDCRIFVRIKHAADIRVRTYAARNAKVTYLFWNEDDCDLKMDETHEALADSDVTVAYGELNDHAIERDTYLALLEPGARGLLSSANLVQTRRSYNMQVVNYAPKTYGNMENYAVVLEKGKL